MRREDFKDKGLLDKLENLKIERYVKDHRLAYIAPTWLISDKTTLEDYLPDFEDEEIKLDSLRDFACMPSTSLHPFFKNPDVIFNNADSSREPSISDSRPYQLKDSFRPLSGVNYYVAFDLSVSKDRLGGACVHREFGIKDDLYVLDWTINIRPSHGELIDYDECRNLVRAMRRRGFRIAKIGWDQFQSHDSFVIMSKEGYDCEIVKYHDSFAGCGFLWDLINHRNISYGAYEEVFMGEASELQVVNSKRIDHLMSGGNWNSKDVWDAVTNACVLASRDIPPFKAEYLST